MCGICDSIFHSLFKESNVSDNPKGQFCEIQAIAVSPSVCHDAADSFFRLIGKALEVCYSAELFKFLSQPTLMYQENYIIAGL